MKKSLTLLIIACLASLSLYGQATTDTAFIYTYGGIQNDVCNQVKPVYDKGYIMIGTTNSFGCGNTSMYAIKTDSLGKRQWSKTYGGSENQEGYSVEPTYDHGYAFLGLTDSYGAGGYDVYLVKTDSVGNILWQKTYGGPDWDFGYSIRQLADSGFIICGQTYSYGAGNGDVYVIRTNKIGDTLWTRAIGGAGYDAGNSVAVLEDSLYGIAGVTTSFGKGDTDVYFMLMDDKGIIKKDTTYGSTHNDIGNSINTTLDKGFVIYGSTDSITPGKTDEMMIKTDSIGNMQWMRIYAASGIGIGKDAVQAPDNTYLTVGTNNSQGLGGYSMHILHLNSGGYYIEGPSFGGTGDEQGASIALAKNGNVVFVGASDSPGYTEGLYDVYLVRMKTDTIVANYTLSIKNFNDDCLCILGIESQGIVNPKIKIFPNPIYSLATILVQGGADVRYLCNIYNVVGQCVIYGIPIQPTIHGQAIGHFDKSTLSTGMYIYNIINQAGVLVNTGKIIVE